MKPSYSCIPQRKNRKAILFCLALLILSAASFFVATQLPAVKALGQLFAVVLLLVFVQINTKFLLTEYCYKLEEGTLSISAKQGNRIKNQGGIPIHDRCFLLTREEWKEKRKAYQIINRFSYCQNFAAPRPYYLLCPQEKGFVCLSFEPDETLVTLLKETISPRKN